MTLRSFNIFLLATVLSVISQVPSFSSAAEDQENLPENSISISFDLVESSMTGTSKIILPAGTPLTLFGGPLDITGALLEIGSKTPLRIKPDEQNIVTVPAAAEEQTVYLSWTLLNASGMDDNLVSDRGITLAGFWHPLPDIDMAYRLEARLPDNFTAISEAETLSYCLDRFNNRYLTTSFDHPVRSIHFAAGPYNVVSRTLQNNITLSAFFFEEDLALADEYLDKAESYLILYEDMLGPYPYTRFSIVENRLPTGYGMPTFTLLGQAVVRLPFIKDTSLGHEVLHSWFGNSVQVKESGGNWSEGLTTYLADQYYAEQKDEDVNYRKNQLLRYESYVHQDNEVTLQNFTNASHSQPMARQVRAVGYDKASMVFHMLRKELGDDLFFQGLQKFYQKYKYTRAGWDEIESSFAELSGRDLTTFFDQWLTRWDLPKLSIDIVDVTQENGQSKISFTLKQKSIQPYSLQVPVVIKTRNAEVQKSFTVTEQSQQLEILVDSLPTEMAIDPNYDLMRMISSGEIPPLWSQFMGAKEKIAVLPENEQDTEIYSPLISILENLNSEIVVADEIDNDDLDEGSFVFLGNSKHSLGLFADPNHSDQGVTVDIRKNPLSPGQVAVLLSSPDKEQTARIVRRLNHYGKYSYLYFENGRVLDKKVNPSDKGIRVNLFTGPKAVRVPDISSFDEIVEEIKKDKVVYVGETHNDLGSHILQLQVIQALFEENPNIAIGMEMFPRSSQDALDRYISGEIETEKEFIKESNYYGVWGFDYRYYRDIISYAQRNKIPLVALNIKKDIVSQVFKDGHMDGLENEQIEEVPVERKLDTPGYRRRLIRAFSAHDKKMTDPERMGGFIQAQSIWDEAMAESIVTYLHNNPERRMVVIAGNGHVYKDSAIPPRVARQMDISQNVLSSIHFGTDGLIPGYKVDYLVYTRQMELEPAPKVGIVLEKETIEENSDKTRLRITKISPHGKAIDAGIKENDIILSLENQEVEDITDMKIILMDKQPGDFVTMKVLRKRLLGADEELELEVELSSPMSFGGMPPSHPK